MSNVQKVPALQEQFVARAFFEAAHEGLLAPVVSRQGNIIHAVKRFTVEDHGSVLLHITRLGDCLADYEIVNLANAFIDICLCEMKSNIRC